MTFLKKIKNLPEIFNKQSKKAIKGFNKAEKFLEKKNGNALLIADKVGDAAKVGAEIATNLGVPGSGIAKHLITKLDDNIDKARSKRQQLIDRKNAIKDKMPEQLRSKLNMDHGYSNNVVSNEDQLPLLNTL